ncbi:response regulator transcription factor [Hymenobacter sp. RP-2-7]|uniref:Response regulator transcription factor n=1 Tax=Hymenobacter polaris TaxID=2682546 RepID=A0A7Y0AG26_9BACT|nr:response regulator transcription factor [Hymenobacter polaris]NML66681.1 response regulator transcription factor [Hymenobacter polaris]
MAAPGALPPLTCVLLDDEPLALDLLADFCAQIPFLTVRGQFHEALAGLAFLQDNPVDVVFLDIHMPRLSGVQLAQLLPAPAPLLVFTTAFDQYAVQSYTLQAADYLLKPIAFDRFLQAALKVRQLAAARLALLPAAPRLPASTPAPPAAAEAMFVKHGARLQRVAFADLRYIEGRKEYLLLHTGSDKLLTLQSFQRVLEALPAGQFVRIHKSFVVALRYIEHVERGKVQVAGQLLPIGDSYREAFLACLHSYQQL